MVPQHGLRTRHHGHTLQVTTPDTAQSALNLRLVLAGLGLAVCLVTGLLALRADAVLVGVLLLALAATAAVDLAAVQRRRAARARAHAGADHRHGSLFE